MELIIEKLKKIKKLAEEGFDGEMQAAVYLLNQQLKKHNLTIDDLQDEVEKERCFTAIGDNERFALLMCCLKVIGIDRSYGLKYYRGELKKQYISLTEIEYIDISQMFDFHKKNMKKEFEKMVLDFQKSYQYKHGLYASENSEKHKSNYKPSYSEWLKIKQFADNMDDNFFHKQINNE